MKGELALYITDGWNFHASFHAREDVVGWGVVRGGTDRGDPHGPLGWGVLGPWGALGGSNLGSYDVVGWWASRVQWTPSP